EMGKGRFEAAMLASKEIGFTIVSMTVSLVAVFIPVLFLGGMVGRLLHEFSVTIIVAILISGFVSLTFTPMLSSRYLPSQHRRHGVLYVTLERGFEAIARSYDYTLRKALRHHIATLAVALAMLVGTVYLDRKSTRLNSSHVSISYAVFCLKKKNSHNIELHSGFAGRPTSNELFNYCSITKLQ